MGLCAQNISISRGLLAKQMCPSAVLHFDDSQLFWNQGMGKSNRKVMCVCLCVFISVSLLNATSVLRKDNLG